MKVLVTGAAGFAGSNIVRFLVSKGHEVTGLYRNHRPAAISDCTFLQQDISQKIDIDGDFEAIVHTACAHPKPENTFQILKRDNIDSMDNLLAFADKKKISIFINLSTKNVYGTTARQDITEDAELVNQDLYGLSKYAAECLLREAKGIKGLSLRLPGLVGKGAHDIWLVRMVKKLQAGEDVTVADILAKNFVWIDDLCAFVEKQLRLASQGKDFLYNTVNLACSDGCSNIAVVKEIKKRLGSASIITAEKPKTVIGNLDVSKAVEMGYQPHSPLQIADMYLKSLGY